MWRQRRAAVGALLGAPLALGSGLTWRTAAAQATATDGAAQWRLERDADGLYLSARVPLRLPPPLADALQRGVPLHFVWHVEVWRPRWYWTDRLLGQASRTVRVVFQPLTGRWRLSVHDGSAVNDGQATLHRALDTLEEALALARSVQRWRVASAVGLRGDERVSVEYRIDTGRLPRPLQWLPGHGAADDLPAWRIVLRVPSADTPAQMSIEPGERDP
ncbi:DUF4390 domain-containing protein [Tepidimonas charontis]|uniref:DUF4390 domain-containing protein n=1 Tax=Tepidimonas charontis TaxID=2267262 RepID=A0A554XIY8_9BURK|nr:DUF4390 domain-containing protein [Tepidimonas charontis]TSE35785.1 hypothetical protein Tchar_00569 [Tepidimonas charontis]